MDYAKLVNDLVREMKKGVQYKRLPPPYKTFAVVGMIPWIVFFVISKFFYMVTLFFYKMISAPADYLHNWLTEQKDDVQHATQAVMYFVCLPFIFFLRVLLSFSAVLFFLQWFLLMIQAYLLTLGGIKWQPFITEVTFEEEADGELAPGATAACVFVCAVFALFVLHAVTYLLSMILEGDPAEFLGGLSRLISVFYYLTSAIINPCLFKNRHNTETPVA